LVPRLLQRCNEPIVPAAELRISVYLRPGVFFNFAYRGWGRFFRQSIFEPGEPQCAMPAALLMPLRPQNDADAGRSTVPRRRRLPGSDETIFVSSRQNPETYGSYRSPRSTGFKRDFAPCRTQRTLGRLKFGVPLKIAGLKICPTGWGLPPSKV
jgi:hypothetical protein